MSHSFLSYMLIYVILMAVILNEIEESTERNMTQYRCPLDGAEMLLLLWVFASLLHLLEHMYIYRGDFWKDFWNIYTTLNVLFFTISYLIWFAGYLYHSKGNK